MKVVVKDIEVLLAMHGLDEYDEDELDYANFRFGWCDEMLKDCGKVFDVHDVHIVDDVCAYINGYTWAKEYLIMLEDEDDL